MESQSHPKRNNRVNSNAHWYKVSGGTRSDPGRDARDTFLGPMKTCDKLGVSFWDNLGSRLMAESAPAIAPWPNIVGLRASQSALRRLRNRTLSAASSS